MLLTLLKVGKAILVRFDKSVGDGIERVRSMRVRLPVNRAKDTMFGHSLESLEET